MDSAEPAPLLGVAANPKAPGLAPATQLSIELAPVLVAQGSAPLGEPRDDRAPRRDERQYWLLWIHGPRSHGGDTGTSLEAQKTEPDKNTYLTLNDQLGPDSHYDYGTHFLFQGHEVGIQGRSYITRVNLDADAPHRVTLWATALSDGTPLAGIDGSTYDPFAKRLIFTTENSSAGTYSSTLEFPLARRHFRRDWARRLRRRPK